MDVHYQRISDHEDDNDSHNHTHNHNEPDLWDQLNDQQSREVQQHQSRFHAPGIASRSRPANILVSMAQSTVERVGESAKSAWTAAQRAWRQYPQQQQNNRSTNSDDPNSYYPAWYQYPRAARRSNAIHDLDQEFGLQDLRPTTFEERPSSQNNNNNNNNNNQNNDDNNNNNNNNNPFVVLSNFPRRAAISSSEQDHWGMVANMDVFLTHLYSYYYNRGLVPIICKFIVEFAGLLLTLWLSRILFKRVDWRLLSTCKDEDTCLANWSDYYYYENINNSDEDNNNNNNSIGWIHWLLVQGYTWLFLAYAAFSCWTFRQNLQQAMACQYIVHEKLGISKRKLQGGAVAWDTVVTQLMQAQDSGEYRLALQELDPLNIAQRIMRKENFLIAFWNQGLLDGTMIGGRHYWCPSLEWCLHTCLLNFMFNHKYEIRPAFYLDAASLQRRLQVCAIVHAVLLPFLILFVVLHFLLRNVYDFKTTRQYMGNKQWSPVARWTFQEFNELPHILEQRLEPSYEAAESYVKLFGTSEWIAAVGKLFVFTGGAVGGVIFVLGVMNDAILLHVQLWGRNLLWYAGIAGIVYSVGKALLPTKEAQPSVTRNLFADMDAALKQVSTHTHYYPENWKGRGWDSNVYKSFGKFFDSKVKLFVWEMAALVLAPYILFARLSKCAPAICEFCLVIKTRVPGSGDVCGYSSFDFDTFKDEAWEGRTLGKSVMPEAGEADSYPTESLSESILRTGNVEDATRQHPKPKAREGKMEKSFFSFQAANPNWKCSPSGQSLVDRVEEYRKAELAAISRERGLYIEAAARQLETLAKLEQQRSPHSTRRFQEERMHDSHIPRVPPADAGAGSYTLSSSHHLSTRRPLVRPSSPTIPPLHHHHHHLAQPEQPQPNVMPSQGSPFSDHSTIPEEQSEPSQLNEAPDPPSQVPSSSSSSDAMSTLADSSRVAAPHMGLSTELRRILDMSTSLHASESALQESAVPTNNAHPLPPPAMRTPTEQQVRKLLLYRQWNDVCLLNILALIS
jgi:autophagy-related protein 9